MPWELPAPSAAPSSTPGGAAGAQTPPPRITSSLDADAQQQQTQQPPLHSIMKKSWTMKRGKEGAVDEKKQETHAAAAAATPNNTNKGKKNEKDSSLTADLESAFRKAGRFGRKQRDEQGDGVVVGQDYEIGDDSRMPGQGRQQGRGLQFHQPFSISWSKIKRKVMLASTGTPSSGEGRSESSETSGNSRQQLHAAYVLGNRNAQQHNNKNGNAVGGEEGNGKQVHMDGEEEDWSVNQIVVDTDFFDEDGQPLHPGAYGPGSAHGDAGGANGERVSNSGRDTTTAHSETAGSIVKSPTFHVIDGFITFFVGYIIPKCQYFFEPRFGDKEKEINFRKERWYNTKRNAWFGSCFLILNWILVLALTVQHSVVEKVLYWGAVTLFTVPMPVLVAFDLPRKRPYLYSFWGAAACGCLGVCGVITMRLCRFLDGGQCNGNQYLLVSYYSTGFAVLALFAMHVNRFAVAVFQATYFALVCGLAITIKPSFARNVVNFVIYSIFIQYLHWSLEKSDRRMYTLRVQLKISYRAQQKAQIAEKKASNSKRRFISYIFHEVRVPLNTAYLAFQNLQAAGNFDRRDEDQMVEVYALESSLQQVQQVLNDVLDLQRMDAGKFESVNQPFHFHRAINALNASLRVATTAKKLDLDISLDERIDKLPNHSIDWQGSRATFVIGDEIRLRQVLTNLASNAVKFTKEGHGRIGVTTKLIYPDWDGQSSSSTKCNDSSDSERKDKTNEVVLYGGVPVKTLDSANGGSQAQTWAAAPPQVITPLSRDGDRPQDWKGLPHSSAGTDRTFHSQMSQDIDIEKHAGATPYKDKEEEDDERELQAMQQQSGPSYPIAPPIQLENARMDSNDTTDSDKMARRDCIIVRIEISDTGPGIRPSDMVDLRLFSPYVQTEVGRVQGGKGSGLGLAIVRAIVQLAGGRMGVNSSKDGSTFWLEFRYPVALASEVQALQEPPTPMSIASASIKPHRPPIKPYKDGESSYSQWSASRFEAASIAAGYPVTPSTVEKERELTAGIDASLTPGSASSALPASGAPVPRTAPSDSSRHPSISSGMGVPLPQATSMDVQSPLTSEQWTASTFVERSILPAMTVTASISPTPSATIIPQQVRSSPSPPLVDRRISSQTDLSVSSGPPEGFSPISPIGEDAFTPNTREEVATMPSPPLTEMPPSVVARPSSSASSSSSSTAPLTSHAAVIGGSASTPLASVMEQKAESLKALVVDDDPLTRKLMSRMMTRLGCDVEDAENGQVCLDILLGSEGRLPKYFDIVTLDNAMPVMTGEQAIKVLRAAGRTDLVVGATGNALKSDQDSYLKAGVDSVLCKPISIKDLKAMLVLAQRRRDDMDANTPRQHDFPGDSSTPR